MHAQDPVLFAMYMYRVYVCSKSTANSMYMYSVYTYYIPCFCCELPVHVTHAFLMFPVAVCMFGVSVMGVFTQGKMFPSLPCHASLCLCRAHTHMWNWSVWNILVSITVHV